MTKLASTNVETLRWRDGKLEMIDQPPLSASCVAFHNIPGRTPRGRFKATGIVEPFPNNLGSNAGSVPMLWVDERILFLGDDDRGYFEYGGRFAG